MTKTLPFAAVLVGGLLGCGGGSSPEGSGGSGSSSASSGSSSVSSGSSSVSSGSGSASSGSGSASSASASTGTGLPPHTMKPCPVSGSDAAVGVWENITPPMVDLATDTRLGANFGMQALVIDPSDTRTVYVGADCQGLYKSTDCGATWVKINTGKNGAELDTGRQWSMVIDPVDPQTIYTNAGYGTSGVFRTKNGGVDWDQTFSSDVAKQTPYGGFIGSIAMDPGDHLHLLASFHAECAAPFPSSCFAESHDGGDSWKVRGGDPSWGGGEGSQIDFLDSTTWIFGSQSNGLWRSADSGQTWKQVADTSSIGHSAGALYRAKNGSFFHGSNNGVLYSKDGIAWSVLPGSPNLSNGIAGDGETIYVGRGGPWNYPGLDPMEPYFSTSETNPGTWTNMQTPMMRDGGLFMAYDPDHHILYSSNLPAGAWRVQLAP